MTHSNVQDVQCIDDNTSKPLVSVLIPCYNAAANLREAMQSIQNQTLRALEIIAVDDGSTDQTLEILERIAREDPRVRVLTREHAGIIPTLNAGLQTCRAPFIARMDADDISFPERLQRQVDFLKDNPSIAAVSCLVEGFPPGNVREGFRIYIAWLNQLISAEDIARELYIESPLPHPSMLLRREWLAKIGGYQEHGWPEDYDLWLRMHLAGATFAKVPEVLLRWREHPQRLTRTDSRYAVRNFLRAKAHYLCKGPIQGRDALIVWGAGQMGRRLSKHLLAEGAPLVAFIDIDPKKIGRTKRDRPILAPKDLLSYWQRYRNPILLAAVGSRGARSLIRQQLSDMGLVEGRDWWAAA